MDRNIQATARVQLTVEIALSQPWGGTSAINELYDRAGKQAVEKLVIAMTHMDERTIIIGQPKIIGVITESK